MDKHNFWKTQPIQDTSKKEKLNNPNDISEDISNLFTEKQINLPENFFWAELDPNLDTDIDLLHNFLYENYMEKNDNFGLHYTKVSLRWYLSNPKFYKNMFLFVKYKNKVVGSIVATPENISIFDKSDIIFNTTFLCIDKNIREKSLGAIMIKELLRRMYFNNVKYGYYTSPLNLPNKLTLSNYYHRPLNIKKLLDINFINKPDSISIKSFEKLYKTKDKKTTNYIQLKLENIKLCTEAYNNYYKKYKIYQIMNEDEFKYKFLPVDNIIDTFVIINNNNIKCFISIFYLKSRILNNSKYKDYDIAQIYHYFYLDEKLFLEFLEDILIYLKDKNIDVVNWIEQMDNYIFFEKLKFCKGSGEIYYHFWNKSCPNITNKDIALVTL
jgi:glycylpeptide N-tetradecanoyltransferase